LANWRSASISHDLHSPQVRRAYCLTNESLTSSFFPFTIPVAWYELFSSCLLVLGKNRRFIRGTRRHSCISSSFPKKLINPKKRKAEAKARVEEWRSLGNSSRSVPFILARNKWAIHSGATFVQSSPCSLFPKTHSFTDPWTRGCLLGIGLSSFL